MSWKVGEVEGNGSELWELTEGYVAITVASSLSCQSVILSSLPSDTIICYSYYDAIFFIMHKFITLPFIQF